MTEVVSLVQESREVGDFYAPQFEVLIENSGLPPNVLRDVQELTYKDNVAELDSFEMTVNNWDPDTDAFKFVGAETAQDLRGEESDSETNHYRLFEPCRKTVKVRMGYAGRLRTMLTGNFTSMEPNFPSAGAPTLTVRGLNVLHQLRSKPYTWAWENKRDSEIAENLATLRDEESGNQRFPLPIEIDESAKQREPVLPYVAQDNLCDIDFLMMRARERGYVLFVLEEDQERGLERRLYFGPSHGGRGTTARDVIFELEWGKSILEMKPTLTTAKQVRSVTVKGWNRSTKEQIEATVDLDDPELNRNRDLHELLSERCDPREEVVVNEPVFTQQQAENRARSLLRDRQGTMVQANVTTVGLPDLRAGRLVVIGGIGARFGGTYFVTETTHTINAQGYLTRFSARREDEGGMS